MPRNSQGVYTLPAGNPVVPGTLIETTWANPTMSDIADALTGSLPRDGTAPMTGPLTLPAGSPTGALHATNKAYVDSFMAYASGLAIGAVVAFASTTVPPGFLLCDGQAVSRTTYADLFATIGTTFGSGDGATTFNVPDMRDQFMRGRGASRQLGSTQAGALAAHVHAFNDPGHAHSAFQTAHAHSVTVAAHGHTVNDPGHTHSANAALADSGSSFYSHSSAAPASTVPTLSSTTGVTVNDAGQLPGSTDTVQPGVTVTAAATGASIGATGDAETRPQNMAFDFIIKAVNDSVGAGVITGVTTSDANMLSVDNANPVVPNLVLHSNVAFGMVKLDINGKVPVAQMPAGVQTFLGTFDPSGGQNPSEAFPGNVYTDGMTYLLSNSGTITVHDPNTNVNAATAVDLGWNLVWLQNSTQPVGWYYIEAATVTAATASSVAFVPSGTITATNVQAAIEELDSETQASLTSLNNAKAAVGNAVPTMDGTAAPGTALAASREDHVHPTDTSRAPASAATAAGTSYSPGGGISAATVQGAIQELDSEKATIASPAFTGNPTAPTPAASDNDTSIATTAFVKGVVQGPAFTGYQAGPIAAGFALTVLTDIIASFDPTGAWNPTADRFQPNVAGLYQVNMRVTATTSAAMTYAGCVIRINAGGAGNQVSSYVPPYSNLYAQPNVSALIHFNGTTDFIQFLVDAAGAAGTLNWSDCIVSAALVRPDA